MSRSQKAPVELATNVLLAARTTLGVGGPVRYWAPCRTIRELVEVLDWARSRTLEISILGGGSNLLASDAGFDGLVIELTDDRIELVPEGDVTRVKAGAGAGWDALVARAVAAGLGGLECLSGIPGRVGAAPIQNVGAYGQEVSETLATVEVVDLESGERRSLTGAACGFGYRDSHFKGRWRGRFAVTRVDFLLPRRALGCVRYPDLERRLAGHAEPALDDVRRAVLDVRRSKSMVLEPHDPNRRSAGSFFVNPVMPAAEAEEIRARARTPMPAFPAAGGKVKLSAARLIEAAGLRRGDRLGGAAISSRHVLALINTGDATAADIVALAAKIRRRVRSVFGVTLRPEPVFLGFGEAVDDLLG